MKTNTQHANELRCCLGCGRDTYGLFCGHCGGHNPFAGRGRGRRAWPITDMMPLEDDYSEESDANSVCDDNSTSVSLAHA